MPSRSDVPKIRNQSYDSVDDHLDFYNTRSVLNTIHSDEEHKRLQSLFFEKRKSTTETLRYISAVHNREFAKIKVPFLGLKQHRQGKVDIFLTNFLDKPLLKQLTCLVVYVILMWFCFGVGYFALNWLIHKKGDSRYDTCITGTNPREFTGHFLYAIESGSTIGFGVRFPKPVLDRCWPVLLLQTFQPIITLATESFVILLVFLKMSTPPNNSIYEFIKKCVICERNGQLTLGMYTTKTL